jgi:hypothetical protein
MKERKIIIPSQDVRALAHKKKKLPPSRILSEYRGGSGV